MKIIDFRKKGNVVRFYLGADDCDDYWGDDWNDRPYESNAEKVNYKYIVGHRDIAFPIEYAVLEPCDGHVNSPYTKEDMKKRRIPCIIAINDPTNWWEDEFDKNIGKDNTIKFYFGDKMSPSESLSVFKKGFQC